jgi:hypothetical protein
MRLLSLPLIAPEPGYARCCAQFPRACVPLAGNEEGALQVGFRFCRIRFRKSSASAREVRNFSLGSGQIGQT